MRLMQRVSDTEIQKDVETRHYKNDESIQSEMKML